MSEFGRIELPRGTTANERAKNAVDFEVLFAKGFTLERKAYNLEDGDEVDVIRIERLNVLLDENEMILANVQNLHSPGSNMNDDPSPVVPIIP